MLFDIFVKVPSLMMSQIAWWICVAVALSCLLALFAAAALIIAFRWRRAEREPIGIDQRKEPPPAWHPQHEKGAPSAL
jgi:hypothetical protein